MKGFTQRRRGRGDEFVNEATARDSIYEIQTVTNFLILKVSRGGAAKPCDLCVSA